MEVGPTVYLIALLSTCIAVTGQAAPLGLHAWLSPEELALPTDAAVKMTGTTDPERQGADYRLLAPGETTTILTVQGPAVIHRVWSTAQFTDNTRLVVKLDGQEQVLWEKAALPANQPEDDPIRAMNGQAYIRYVPIRVSAQAEFIASDLRPAAEKKSGGAKASAPEEEGNKFYLQVAHTEGSEGAVNPEQLEQVRRTLRLYTGDPLAGSADIVVEGHQQAPKAQKARLTLDTPIEVDGGPATYIKTLIIDTGGLPFEQLEALRLVVHSDGADKPCVDVPLPYLFCAYWGLDEYDAPVTAIKGSKLVLRLPIPVGEGLQLSLAALGKAPASVSLDATLVKATAAQPLPYRFCAQYHAAISKRDEPVHMADIQGEGVYVGCTFAADGLDHRKFGFLEGNEQIYVDREEKPSWEGTGTEDYFNGAWYFSAGVSAHPFHGLTHLQEDPPPRMSSYRYLIPDRIAFKTHLKVDMQHGSRNSVPETLYKSVSLWYQKPPCSVTAADEVVVSTSASEAADDDQPDDRIDTVTPTILGIIALLFLIVVLRSLFRRER